MNEVIALAKMREFVRASWGGRGELEFSQEIYDFYSLVLTVHAGKS